MAIISDFFLKVIIYIFKTNVFFLKSLNDAFKKIQININIVKYYYNI